jgi:predicted TPR repeat methyltransferase
VKGTVQRIIRYCAREQVAISRSEPETPIASRFGPLGVWLKRSLREAIRYYVAQQAVYMRPTPEELERRHKELERQHELAQRAFDGPRGALFRRAVREQSRTTTALTASIEALSVRVNAIQQYEAARHGEAAALGHALRSAQDAINLLRTEVLDLNGDLARRASYLESYTADMFGEVRALDTATRPMLARLDAVPYRSVPPEGFFPATRSSADGFDYVGFESVFRGPEELVRERQSVYVPFFAGRRAVLDIGCGRGEFLELMRDARITTTGVDLNPAMVALCRSKGLPEVHEADAVAWLEQSGSTPLDGIFSAQFIEHIPFDSLVRLVAQAYERLSAGGVFIAETVNPLSIDAFKTFYVDPSHVKPLFPEVMAFLCRSVGFADVRVFYPNGGGFDEAKPSSQNEYAIVAIK